MQNTQKNIFLILFFISCYLVTPGLCQQSPQALKKLEAMAYYYIVSFTTWPEKMFSKTLALNICVLDDHSLLKEFQEIFKYHKKGGKILTLKVLKFENFQELDSSKIDTLCQVFILSDNKEKNLKLIKQINALPILSISSEKDITAYGGIFYIAPGKAPKINLKALNKSGLKIDPTLLSITEIIK